MEERTVEKYQKIFAVIVAIAIVSVVGLVAWNQSTQNQDSIYVYCGAGLRKPMEDIGNLFEDTYGIKVEYNYAGSETLLSQMELNEEGDVYMPGATLYIERADEKGFIGNQSLVAYHTPIIAVPEGNPANIACLQDLADPGVEIVLGDAEAAACGKIANKVLEKNGLFEAVDQNVVSRTATANELAVYISQGQADAAICWNADLCGLDEVTDVIPIPEEQNIIKIIPIGTLTFTEKDDKANQFIDFVSSETGKEFFEQYDFIKYEG
jgi:molybdate transport system substrate-binding protein